MMVFLALLLVTGLTQAETNVTVTGKQGESRSHGWLGWEQEAASTPMQTPGGRLCLDATVASGGLGSCRTQG